MLLRQPMPCALVFALAKAGKRRPARMAMIAITTSSSIKVKAATAPDDFGTSRQDLDCLTITDAKLCRTDGLSHRPPGHLSGCRARGRGLGRFGLGLLPFLFADFFRLVDQD